MAKGSKSFSLAALFFAREHRLAARQLYAWCRYCDDAIDGASSQESAKYRLEEIRQGTLAALKGEASTNPAFIAFANICRTYQIPELYPLEFLEGMRMDVEGFHYRNENDLRLYCYRVAGVVGLMMVHIMGVSSERALRHALDTGIAMQLTNIARDVREDFALGRVYLPEVWIERPGRFDAKDFLPAVQHVLALAEQHYKSGASGIRYLPLRAAFAVAAAQSIYREIGQLILQRGMAAWDERAVVSKHRKLWLAFVSVVQVTTIGFVRLRFRWKRVVPSTLLGPGQI